MSITKKQAIAKLLTSIMSVDGEEHQSEFNILLEMLQVDEDFILQTENISFDEAIENLSNMTEEQKTEFCKMMYLMIVADGVVRTSEVQLVREILIKLHLSDNLINYSQELFSTIVASKFHTFNNPSF